MNGWDLFTWINCVILAGVAIVIFGFFLKDSKGILGGDRSGADAPSGGDSDRPERSDRS
jgi:hypothetical protein